MTISSLAHFVLGEQYRYRFYSKTFFFFSPLTVSLVPISVLKIHHSSFYFYFFTSTINMPRMHTFVGPQHDISDYPNFPTLNWQRCRFAGDVFEIKLAPSWSKQTSICNEKLDTRKTFNMCKQNYA
jgi:hypothetical protein